MKRTGYVSGFALGAALAVHVLFLNGGVLAAEPVKAPPQSAKAKPKPWKHAWAPPKDKPLRGIIINYWHALQGGELREPWLGFCEKHGLAWTEGDERTFEALDDLATELGRPELVNAPVIWAGLSAGNLQGTLFAQQHPDRVLALVGTAPVAAFIKGNDGFNFNRPKLKGHKGGNRVHDVSNVLGIPVFLQTGERDNIVGSAQAYGFCDYGRRKGSPWTYYCLPRARHGGNKNEVVMPWLEAVMAQRLPTDMDLRQQPPKLKAMTVQAGWLGNTQTLAIEEYSKYAGDKAKAAWLPDKTSAEAWKKYGLGMPYVFPEQPLRQPSGLIGNLVVHHSKHNQIIPPDEIYGDGWKIVANLKEGDVGGLTAERRFCMSVIGKVPERVRGCDWIRPDNLAMDFSGEVLLEFTVSKDAVVYVAHDETVPKKPDWLAEWKDTGEFVLGGYLGTERRFRLFEKTFPKDAKVKLGPNGENPKTGKRAGNRSAGWIYMTIVKPDRKTSNN
jgi:hypothetical protein